MAQQVRKTSKVKEPNDVQVKKAKVKEVKDVKDTTVPVLSLEAEMELFANVEDNLLITSTEPTPTDIKHVPTIHDKYRRYLKQVKDNYLNGLDYAGIMEILRYTERKMGHNIPINVNCGTCVIDLLKLFAQIEEK